MKKTRRLIYIQFNHNLFSCSSLLCVLLDGKKKKKINHLSTKKKSSSAIHLIIIEILFVNVYINYSNIYKVYNSDDFYIHHLLI